jgi:hypothetical protein
MHGTAATAATADGGVAAGEVAHRPRRDGGEQFGCRGHRSMMRRRYDKRPARGARRNQGRQDRRRAVAQLLP